MPSGQSWEAEATSSHYSSFFWPSHSFINLSFLPPAPFTLAFCFLRLHWCAPSHSEPLCISLLNSCSSFKHPPLSIFHRGSLILELQFIFSLLTLRRLNQTNSIIKVKSEVELWSQGFFPQGKFPSGEATVYTSRCLHRKTPSSRRVNTHSCVFTRAFVYTHRNFPILEHTFFFTAKHYPCASCVLQLWTLFVPVLNCRMKATELSGLFSRAK